MKQCRDLPPSGAGAEHLRRDRAVSRLGWAVLFVCLIGSPAPAGEPMKTRVHSLEPGGRILDFAIADVDGDGHRDLLLAHLEGDGRAGAKGRLRRLISVFRQDPKSSTPWPKRPTATRLINPDASLFAAGEFYPAKGREIALLSKGGVDILFSGGAKTPALGLLAHRLRIPLREPGFFDFPAEGGLFRWSLARDLGGDKRDELLFPTKAGYLILSPDGKGNLKELGSIRVPSTERFGPPLETQFLNRLLTYFSRLPRVVAIDINSDGRTDLVAYRSKGLSRYLQRKDGRFPAKPDTQEALSVVKKAAKKSKGGDKDSFATVKLALKDLNGDKHIDIVATKTVGKLGVFESLRTQVLVFLGGPKGIQDEKPDQIINLKGVTLFPEFTDFNGDGDLDIVLSSLRMDLLENVKRAILDTVSTTYSVYLFRGGKRVYSRSPDFERTVEVELEVVEKQGQVRLSYFTGDLNGDGLKDMVSVAGRDRLEIVPGGIESSFWSGKHLVIDDDAKSIVKVPTSPHLHITDIDGDGRDEVLIFTKRSSSPERNRLRIVEALP